MKFSRTSAYAFLLISSSLILTSGLSAQDADNRADNYLSAIEAKKDPALPFNNQYRAWYWAILGDEQKAYTAFCETETDACDTKSIKGKAGATDIEEVMTAASQADLFILNEAHHASRHRAYMTAILPLLKELGYTHFAAEALEFVTRERLEGGEYPATNGNLYIHDPHFAELLATAHELGFTLLEYEQTQEQRQTCTAENQTERINCREKAQEENILNTISQQGALRKTVIYVGFNHGNLCAKETEFGEERRLAHLLSKRFPNQVVSVTQTTSFAPENEVESGQPRVFHKTPREGESCQNFEVIHSTPKLAHERDTWLFSLAGREPVQINLPDSLKGKEIIIRAHHIGSDIYAEFPDVPFDQFVFKGDQATLALAPGGDYILSALHRNSIVPLGEIRRGRHRAALSNGD